MENPTPTSPKTDLDDATRRSAALKTRHATALARLLAEREDLRGTHAFADFVDESLRWTA